jgi:signal transduction histidine kinase
MVRPLRRITAQVERIGAGDYAATLPEGRRDEFGRLAGTINQMAHEISASVESLQSADRMRRELVANVGHDLRTPLAALRGYVEEALRYMSEGDADRARNCLHTVESQANYLATLVADLFELSILDSAEPRLRVEPVPLSELLTEAARSHEAEFKRRGITLERDFPGTLPTITGDGVRLLRLLDNLLANARNHTPQGGRVSLAARRDGHYAEISVTDSGSGLSEADAQFVFDRYYRGDDARTRGRKGTGLGLAIARAIAVAHDGRLEARSDPGGGACFVLRLPEEGRSKLSPIAPV